MRILRILRSQVLPCECLVGIYETYDGTTVRIVDSHARRCREPQHREGATVNDGGAGAPRESGQGLQ